MVLKNSDRLRKKMAIDICFFSFISGISLNEKEGWR